MATPKVGDTVRFLNSTGGGRVVRIDGNIAHVEDTDGFEVPALLRECVVVMDAGIFGEKSAAREGHKVTNSSSKTTPNTSTSSTGITADATKNAPSKDITPQASNPEPELPIVELPGGDKLNLMLAFAPTDIKALSTADYEVLLVNDSNYYLSFTFATRSDDSEEWTLRRAGVVEPNIVLTLCDIPRTDINMIDRVRIDFISYKQDKPYAAKPPVSVEKKIDNTKFFKLHCFRPNIYFDEQVIGIDIMKDDRPTVEIPIDDKALANAMREKRAVDRPKTRPVKKHDDSKTVLEVDLHIDQLVDTTAGLSRADMLNCQIDEFRRVMDSNLRNHGRKIVFIHGKGEGVLRQALLKELNHRYKGHDVSDASFREYGFGATQVVIR